MGRDTENDCSRFHLGTATIEANIQDELGKIGVLAAEIFHNVHIVMPADSHSIENYVMELDRWHHGLPPMLHISTLGSPRQGNISPIQCKWILLMHM
jgi:hypothetical protein